MNLKDTLLRPKTLYDVAEISDSITSFGMNLRDWQHEIQRGGVHSHRELAKRIDKEPRILANQFDQGDIADAYLAAYAEWIADRAKIQRPEWCSDPRRVARTPWFSTSAHAVMLLKSPASFRQRNLFTIPEDIFIAKPGRPRVSPEQKRRKAILRQAAYRKRIRALVNQARMQNTL